MSESLFSLNLAQTGLFSLPKITSKGLKHLNISHNKIYEIEKHDMIILKKVREFDTSWNNLVNIKPEILKQMVELKYLDLSGNKIHYIDAEQLQHLDQLEILKLSHLDQLIQFPHSYGFAKLRNLKELEIHGIPSTVANYNITQILHVLPPLKAIDIEIKEEELNNQLKLADVRLLRKVTIRGKNLKKINIGAFEKLRGYRLDLAITNTQIDTIPPLLFNTITTISFLKLSLPNNKIQSMNPFLNTKAPILNQHGTILDSLDLQGNPIICDCKMQWLKQWIEYSVEHSTNWHEINEVLDKAECDAMPGVQDTLLSVYGNKIPGVTSKYEPTINIDEKCEHISGSKKYSFTFLGHFILLILLKIFTGF
jgi:Leucine-rich repeat (LRR) protein